MLLPTVKYVFDRRKRAAATKNGVGGIELRISYNRKDKYLSTGIKVTPDKWDDTNQRVVGLLEAKDYNLILSRIHTRVMEILNEMDKSGAYDLDAIPAMLKRKSHDMTFLEYIELRIEKEDGVKADNTVKNHRTFLSQMTEWGVIRTFKDVTYATIQKMNEWLVGRKLKDETIYGYNKFLRKFINDAVREGLLTENPYSTKRIKLKHGDPNVENNITEAEMKKLMKAKLPTESLCHVRDMFVFQCLTGLAYGDLMAFDAKKIREVDGCRVYRGKRGKTGVEFVTVLLDEAMAILKRYKNKLPRMTNQQYNMRLKLVAEAAGIDKQLTSHFGRHAAASIWINKGVPIEIISKMLGHSSTKITEKVYAQLQEKTIVATLKKLQ